MPASIEQVRVVQNIRQAVRATAPIKTLGEVLDSRYFAKEATDHPAGATLSLEHALPLQLPIRSTAIIGKFTCDITCLQPSAIPHIASRFRLDPSDLGVTFICGSMRYFAGDTLKAEQHTTLSLRRNAPYILDEAFAHYQEVSFERLRQTGTVQAYTWSKSLLGNLAPKNAEPAEPAESAKPINYEDELLKAAIEKHPPISIMQSSQYMTRSTLPSLLAWINNPSA